MQYSIIPTLITALSFIAGVGAASAAAADNATGKVADGSGALLLGNPEGGQLAQEYCTQCHVLPHPQQHTGQQWPQVVSRMEFYRARRRLPVPDEKATAEILEYLENNGAQTRQ
jgi:hypothetical protein